MSTFWKELLTFLATFLDPFLASRHFLTPILYLLMADSLKCSLEKKTRIDTSSHILSGAVKSTLASRLPVVSHCFALLRHIIIVEDEGCQKSSMTLSYDFDRALTRLHNFVLTYKLQSIPQRSVPLHLPCEQICGAYNDWSRTRKIFSGQKCGSCIIYKLCSDGCIQWLLLGRFVGRFFWRIIQLIVIFKRHSVHWTTFFIQIFLIRKDQSGVAVQNHTYNMILLDYNWCKKV